MTFDLELAIYCAESKLMSTLQSYFSLINVIGAYHLFLLTPSLEHSNNNNIDLYTLSYIPNCTSMWNHIAMQWLLKEPHVARYNEHNIIFMMHDTNYHQYTISLSVIEQYTHESSYIKSAIFKSNLLSTVTDQFSTLIKWTIKGL